VRRASDRGRAQVDLTDEDAVRALDDAHGCSVRLAVADWRVKPAASRRHNPKGIAATYDWHRFCNLNQRPNCGSHTPRDRPSTSGTRGGPSNLDMVRVVDDQLVDGAFDDADGAGEQMGPLGGGEGAGWG